MSENLFFPLMESSGPCLLCDEEPFLLSPTPSPRRSSSPPPNADEDRDNSLRDLLEREHQYTPRRGYLAYLRQSSNLSAARTRAVRYIAQVCSRLNLATGTAFSAVNYLDRFISMNCVMRWEEWMVDLLSVACLSIASKMDEVSIPSWYDLQMEDLSHSFAASTIQEMELMVLERLDWRLACITPLSYVEVLTWGSEHTRTPCIARTIELLLCALSESEFLRFDPSSVAVSALKTIAGSEAGFFFSMLPFLIPLQHTGEVNGCQKMMDELSIRTHSVVYLRTAQCVPHVAEADPN
ncbi:unnamed protein product [Musa acuminata var. zebrina]